MEFELDEAIGVLRNTPAVVRSLLEGVADGWVRGNYGADTFSAFDVVGHLIHGERTDWIPRTRIILTHGASRPFDPFDRCAMYEADDGDSIGVLLDTFSRLRAENIDTLGGLNLTREQLSLEGEHPALGRVTLEKLIADWVVHDLNHTAQIAKAMAFQYRENVGPWRAYMSILRPAAR